MGGGANDSEQSHHSQSINCTKANSEYSLIYPELHQSEHWTTVTAWFLLESTCNHASADSRHLKKDSVL